MFLTSFQVRPLLGPSSGLRITRLLYRKEIQTPQAGQAPVWSPGRQKCREVVGTPHCTWRPADISAKAQSAPEETHLQAAFGPPRLRAPCPGVRNLRQFAVKRIWSHASPSTAAQIAGDRRGLNARQEQGAGPLWGRAVRHWLCPP